MNGLDVEPSACTWCGIAERPHGRQYADAVGWHAWAQPSQEQILARMKARRLQVAVAKAGALPVPVGGERTLDVVEEELTGVNLALWEEVQAYARLRLALSAAKRGRSQLRETVRQMCNELNGFDCPPPGETPLQLVTRVSIAWAEAERRIAELEAPLATARTEAIADIGDWLDEVGERGAAYLVRTVDIPAARAMKPVLPQTFHEDSCPCPPENPPAPHQVGCFFDGVPVSPPSEHPVDGPSPLFPTVASLRELSSREEPHDSPLHRRCVMPTLDLTKHLLGYGRRDAATGMLHGRIRYPDGSAPTPFGCRWCGTEQGGHRRRWMPGKGVHAWERPTERQIKARMVARRNARKDVCRCPLDDEWRPFAPVFDPYMCEASDCHGYRSEEDPFGGGSYWRQVNTPSAEVSRRCGQCEFRTSVWHVDDGSAEEELHGHVVRVHGGAR